MSANDREWPENTQALDGMFPDDRVSDSSLGEALARACSAELLRLACALLSPDGSQTPAVRQAAEEAVLEALAQAVAQRDRVWQRPSLRAWLARLALKATEDRKMKIPSDIDPIGLAGARQPAASEGSFSDLIGLRQAVAHMDRLERQAMILHEIHGLSEREIAWVLHILPVAATYYVRKARARLARLARENPPALFQAGEKPALSPLQPSIQAFYPAVPLQQTEFHFRAVDLRQRIEAWRLRRRSAVFLREITLIGLVLGGVFFLCLAAGLLPEEIVHTIQTPTPFAKEARPMSRPTPPAPFYYQYRVEFGDTLESVARRAGVSALDILLLNPFNYWPGRGFMLDYGDFINLPAAPVPTGEIALPPDVSPPERLPLDLHSGREAILQRIQDSRLYWRSLWATVQELETGPDGYLGPPLASLQGQVWAVQPDHYMLLYQTDVAPGAVHQRLYLAGAYYWTGPDQGELYADFGEEFARGFLDLFTLPEPIHAQNRLEAIRQERTAGRQALVVDEIRPDGRRATRFWVDTATGVILRWIEFSQNSADVVLRERAITAIAYDQEFPADIFQPSRQWPRQFTSDFRGRPLPPGQEALPALPPWPENGHASLPFMLPPDGLDPAGLPLSLQWPDRWDTNQVIMKLEGTALTVPPRIQVFASGYYLGSLPLENVTFRACRRSPDGRLVALAVGDNPSSAYGKLYWFSLDFPQELHPVHDLSVGESVFAFSPDNLHLAFLGCRPQTGRCAVYIQDLETGERTDLGRPFDYPETLVWSPDGKRLAVVMIALADEPHRTIHVIDLEKMLEIYYGRYRDELVFLDSLNHAWELGLPPLGEVETGCRMP